MLSQERIHMSYGRLNELCRRAVNVIERHQQKTPVVASHKDTLFPIVDRYFDQQEQLTSLKVRGNEALSEGRQAVKDLYRCIRSWLGQLEYEVEGFEPGFFDCNGNSPDSVIGAAERLLDFVVSHQGESQGSAGGDAGEAEGGAGGVSTGSGSGIAFAARLIEDLTATKNRALSKWLEAQDCLAKEQGLRNAIRESSLEVGQALISVRRTLRNNLGSSHRDYQKLRLSRTYRDDADEVESVEQVEAVAGDNAAEDKGNGKGKPADVSAFLQPADQPTPPAGG